MSKHWWPGDNSALSALPDLALVDSTRIPLEEKLSLVQLHFSRVRSELASKSPLWLDEHALTQFGLKEQVRWLEHHLVVAERFVQRGWSAHALQQLGPVIAWIRHWDQYL